MRTFINRVYRALQILLTVLIALLIIPVTIQVVARFSEYVPHFIWTEEKIGRAHV